MRILFVASGKTPRAVELADTLKAMQQAVGGPIQVVYPFEEPVALICHEEGKLLGLPFNRGLKTKEGVLYDIICGPFFLCAAPPDSEQFTSMTMEQMRYYEQQFHYPEGLISINGKLICLPMPVDE